MIKIKKDLEYLLSYKNTDLILGAIYRNTYNNFLFNLNLSLKLYDNKNTLESKNDKYKLKTGVIKQYSFDRDFEAILGGRFSFSLNKLGNEFEYNNLKVKGGLINKNYSSFINFTTTKNFTLDNINTKLYITKFNKYYENAKFFMEANYKKKMEFNENDFNMSIGINYDLNEDSNYKIKLENMKSLDFYFKNKITDNILIGINWNIFLKEINSMEVDDMFKCKAGFSIHFE
jgi:hypothetical protein